jgi:Caspase domain.
MRRALIVGIDDYPTAPLAGCIQDARILAELLERNEDASKNFDCQLVTSDVCTVTRSALFKRIEELFANDADLALLHFSGHGTVNNIGGFLVTPDATQYAEGVRMTDILQVANEAVRVKEVVILLDCCHSGAFGAIPAIDNKTAMLREGLTILSASRATQSAMEVNGRGVFSSLVAGALAGGAADVLGVVSAAGLYAYVEQALGAWDQRPLYKAHVSRLVALRRCHPPVEVAILRKLPKYFSDPSKELLLDPTFEPTCGHKQTDNEAIFSDLQRLQRVRLVVPCGAAHMYDAAVNGKGCSLTPLGRYYWQLANSGRL